MIKGTTNTHIIQLKGDVEGQYTIRYSQYGKYWDRPLIKNEHGDYVCVIEATDTQHLVGDTLDYQVICVATDGIRKTQIEHIALEETL